MDPPELIFGAGLQRALQFLRTGGRAGLELFNYLRSQFPGFTRSQYGSAATFANQNFLAAEQARGLGPNERMPVSRIPIMPDLNVDSALGERYRVVIDVEFQPTPDTPTLIRRFFWNGTRPPTGRDLWEAVLEYLARQIDLWGTTPESQDLDEGDDKNAPEESLLGWDVWQINAL